MRVLTRWAAVPAAGLGVAALSHAADAQTPQAIPVAYGQPSLSDLGQLSIEELANWPSPAAAL